MAVLTWFVIAWITASIAVYLAPGGRFLAVPLAMFGLLALLGGIVGHRYSLAVGALMLVQAGRVWTDETTIRDSRMRAALADLFRGR